MAENVIFILIAGALIGIIWVVFQIPVDPTWAMIAISLLVVPGLYGAFIAPFVPSAKKRVDAMLKIADLKKSDLVYDLGAGDGRVVFRASKNAQKAIGYELSIPLVLWGKLRQKLRFPKAEIRWGNIFKQDYSDANVIFCYLLPGAVENFHQNIWPQLKKGTRVVSNGFAIKNLKPSATEADGKVYLYIKS